MLISNTTVERVGRYSKKRIQFFPYYTLSEVNKANENKKYNAILLSLRQEIQCRLVIAITETNKYDCNGVNNWVSFFLIRLSYVNHYSC